MNITGIKNEITRIKKQLGPGADDWVKLWNRYETLIAEEKAGSELDWDFADRQFYYEYLKLLHVFNTTSNKSKKTIAIPTILLPQYLRKKVNKGAKSIVSFAKNAKNRQTSSVPKTRGFSAEARDFCIAFRADLLRTLCSSSQREYETVRLDAAEIDILRKYPGKTNYPKLCAAIHQCEAAGLRGVQRDAQPYEMRLFRSVQELVVTI